MAVNLNKENFPNNVNDEKSNIIDFPSKKLDSDEDIKDNDIINKFYSADSRKSKLNDVEDMSYFNNSSNGNNKLPPKPIAITILGFIVIGIVAWSLLHKNAQEVYVGDKMVAIIQPKEGDLQTPEELLNAAIETVEKQKGSNVEVNETVSLKPVRASKNEIIPISDVTNKIAENFTFKVEASVLKVDGEQVAIVKNNDEANKILNQVKSKYINKDVKQVSEPTFLQDVKIENDYVNEKDIISNEDTFSILTTNKDQGKEHEIKEGDTLFEIALNNDMSLEEILKANPNLTETTPLKIGSKVKVIVPVPLLSVVTYEEAVYNETIPKTVETIKNDKQYKTYKKVISEGKDGSKQITAKLTKINGIEDKREIISEKVLVQPINGKIEIGTLNTPPKKSIGSFKYPINGKFSSGFGYRGGSRHNGVDLTAPAGTAIKASDGGTVVFSGWYGGYGNMVKIDHGNGFQTLYGHNSRNAVSVGQKVAQGEVIGYVGSTGNSTGNHVHFEVLKNGVAQNPLNYLK